MTEVEVLVRSPRPLEFASGVYVAVSGALAADVVEMVTGHDPAPALSVTEQPSLALTPSVTLTVPVGVALPSVG